MDARKALLQKVLLGNAPCWRHCPGSQRSVSGALLRICRTRLRGVHPKEHPCLELATARPVSCKMQPCVSRSHVLSQLEEMAYLVVDHPEHLHVFLFSCRQPTSKRTGEDRLAFHWRKLPKIAREDDIDASEGPRLLSCFGIWMPAASTSEVRIQ